MFVVCRFLHFGKAGEARQEGKGNSCHRPKTCTRQFSECVEGKIQNPFVSDFILKTISAPILEKNWPFSLAIKVWLLEIRREFTYRCG